MEHTADHQRTLSAQRGGLFRLMGLAGVAVFFSSGGKSRQDDPETDGLKKTLLTWSVIVGLALGFIVWGVFAFYVIGDRWPPGWNYGVIPDVPGKSLYSIRRSEEHRQFEVRPHQSAGPVERQHVRGRPAESTPYMPREEP